MAARVPRDAGAFVGDERRRGGVPRAGALREVGLPPGRSAAALAGFNLGVEAGQLVFVAAALAVAAVARRIGDAGWARRPLAQGIGAAATYWALERAITRLP